MRRAANDELPQPGKFVLGDNEEFFGQLTLKKGAKSLLRLQDDHYVPVHNIPDRCIKGVLNDLTRVSLLNCNAAEAAGSASRGGEGYSFAEVFPQFVVSGDRHIGPTDKAIDSIHFVISDATADLPLNFHPVAIRVSADVTPFGAVSVPA